MLRINSVWMEIMSGLLPGIGTGTDCEEDDFHCDGFVDDDGDQNCDCEGCENAEIAQREQFEKLIDEEITYELHRLYSGYYDGEKTELVPRSKKKSKEKVRAVNEHRTEKELNKIRRKAKFWNQKKIKVEYCSDELVGRNAKAVQQFLHNQAFTNIKMIAIPNSGIENRERSERVKEVLIAGCSFFQMLDMFPYDAEISIHYYEKARISVPISMNEAKGKNVQVVEALLRKTGFTTIVTSPCRPGLLRWRVANGAIKNITIDGNNFMKEQEYMHDVKIEIVYYAKRGVFGA